MTTWESTPLCRALHSLDLHRRIVALGLDGSLSSSTAGMADAAAPLADCLAGSDSFQRAVLWRLHLRVLPLPYTATAFDRITESWCATLFTHRAWYAGQKQKLHATYPHFAKPDEAAAEQDASRLSAAGPAVEVVGSTFSAFGGVSVATLDTGAATSPVQDSAVAAPPPPLAPAAARSVAQTLRQSVASLSQRALKRRSVAAMNLRGSGVIGKGSSPLEDCDPLVADDIIALDLRRTYLVNDPEAPHHLLFNVLAIWRWLNPLIGYQQGMHELAGVVCQVLHRAALAVPADAPLAVAECANGKYVEADVYVLFDALMRTFNVAELYRASSVAGLPPATFEELAAGAAAATATASDGGGDATSPPPWATPPSFAAAAAARDAPDGNGPRRTTLETMCEYVVFQLLRDNSTALFHHLANTNMLDQLLVFLPRWLRTLFVRELAPASIFPVWDALFSLYFFETTERQLRRERAEQRAARGSASLTVADAAAAAVAAGGGVSSPGPRGVADAGGGGGTLRRLLSRSNARGPSSPASGTAASAAADWETGASPQGVVYATAGAAPAAPSAASPPPTMLFSRTAAGIAAALLLLLEDEVLELSDDFSLLKRLTQTPMVPPTVDPLVLISSGMTIARTRPPGLLLVSRRPQDGDPLAAAVGDAVTIDSAAAVSAGRGSAAVQAALNRRSSRLAVAAATSAALTRLTKEQLLTQQRSIGLLVHDISSRIATALHLDLTSASAVPARPVSVAPEDIAIVVAALQEMEYVVDQLTTV